MPLSSACHACFSYCGTLPAQRNRQVRTGWRQTKQSCNAIRGFLAVVKRSTYPQPLCICALIVVAARRWCELAPDGRALQSAVVTTHFGNTTGHTTMHLTEAVRDTRLTSFAFHQAHQCHSIATLCMILHRAEACDTIGPVNQPSSDTWGMCMSLGACL